MSLFQSGDFILASGKKSKFKIECDELTYADWAAIATALVELELPPFGEVYGVPRGGLKLANHLQDYITPGYPRILVVDDVWTTGGSMLQFIEEQRFDIDYVNGAVVFSRGETPWWVATMCEVRF